MLKGEPSLIFVLLKNLLDNIHFYAGDSEKSSVSFQETEQSIILTTIIDNGLGI